MKENFIKLDNNYFIGIDYPSKDGDYGYKCWMRVENDKYYIDKVEYFIGDINE